MNIFNCTENLNWSCFSDWVVDHTLESILFTGIGGGLVKFVIDLINALIIAQKLLRKNKGKIGQGYGTRAADTFIEVWYYKDQLYNATNKEYLNNGYHVEPKSVAVERYLVPNKLVEVYNDPGSQQKKFKAIKNLRNWLILKIIIFDLVHKYGDDPSVYKQLKKR